VFPGESSLSLARRAIWLQILARSRTLARMDPALDAYLEDRAANDAGTDGK
jgi:hypothetical protein